MNDVSVSKSLGWFSIGLGVTQLLAPVKLGRMIGVGDRRHIMRTMGMREVATGIAILSRPRSAVRLWARVAGDVLDGALLAGAASTMKSKRGRIAGALGIVAAAGVADYFAARRIES